MSERPKISAEDFLALALEWRNIDLDDACQTCGGAGICTYGDTSTWHHGIGGQMLTVDVCEKCWGSGSAKKSWPSWRK
jgi:hypothetical protein